jgi:hypothetical protein
MKRSVSLLLVLCLLLAFVPSSFAEQPQKNAVSELYSADGFYEDDVGNPTSYSFHVPQINADTPAAEEINTEIAENFGDRVETQLGYMEDGYSLWSRHTNWEAYWYGSQIFLLITADLEGDMTEYGAYGYDFETGSRVTNEMILQQKIISEEEYTDALRESVARLFEENYIPIPEGVETSLTHDSLLEETLGWLDADQPIFLNRYGEIETWVKIATPAGAGWYYHLVCPFSDFAGEYHSITVVGDTDLVESCPQSARAGETVTVKTLDVTDGDKEISVEGVDGTSVDWFTYQFIMPDRDAVVRVEFIGNGLA